MAGLIDPDEQEVQRIDRAGLRVVHEPITRLSFIEKQGIRVHLQDGTQERFDILYAALGTIVNSGLAQLLGAEHTAEGCLIVDKHQQTSVAGLYAAGDIVAGLSQITVAMGQAAIAATAVHNRLRA